jgi:hypothetical protein
MVRVFADQRGVTCAAKMARKSPLDLLPTFATHLSIGFAAKRFDRFVQRVAAGLICAGEADLSGGPCR